MARAGGNPDFARIRNKDTSASVRKRQQLADDYAREMAIAFARARDECGAMKPYPVYAEWLNDNGYRTRRGNMWTGRQVSRLIKRLTQPGFRLNLP